MQQTIDFYFDFGSPTAYLASTQLPSIARDMDAELIWHPILLGGVFQATGNHSPAEIPLKGVWLRKDLAHFAARYGVPLVHNPHFPINTLHLMRGAIGFQLRKPQDFAHYVTAIYKAMWVDALNLGDPAILGTMLQQADIDPVEFQVLTQDPQVKDKLRADTEDAVQRGIFGVPSMYIGDELFFGQDRLDFVREALISRR